MAIRRITDLPELDLTGTAVLNKAVIEVSYCENGNEHSQFTSKQMSLAKLPNLVKDEILNTDCTFTGKNTFKGSSTFNEDVSVTADFTQTGDDFTVNAKKIELNAENEYAFESGNKISIAAPTVEVSGSSQCQLKLSSNKCIKVDNNEIMLSYGDETSIKAKPDKIQLSSKDVDINFTNDFKILKSNAAILTVNNANQFCFTNDINGTAMQAKWADLAEYYESDCIYEPGTLVKFGGEKEITVADDCANAVVTTRPGLTLNSAAENAVGVALIGRVPVKVVGKVSKFDNIVLSDIPGIGVSQKAKSGKVIGKALCSNDDEGIKLVECVVKLEF